MRLGLGLGLQFGNKIFGLTRQIAAASSALGGTILSMQCLAQLVSANTDEGQLSKTFQIKAATEAAGGTLLSPSCLYNLVKNNWL